MLRSGIDCCFMENSCYNNQSKAFWEYLYGTMTYMVTRQKADVEIKIQKGV